MPLKKSLMTYDVDLQIALLYENMTYIQNITGTQMGSYFGYALAAGDIDKDGWDDLIVGAPMYTVPNNPEMTIETGTIYVFYARGPDRYTKVDQRSVNFLKISAQLANLQFFFKLCITPKSA